MRQNRDKRTDSSKRNDPQTTKSFTLHKLPPEIIHLIHKYLDPTDVAKVRFVSHNVAHIGLEYLVPCIHLRLTTASYNRLIAVSRHLIISKHVHEIRYDSDFMKHISWEYFGKRRLTAREPAPSTHDGRSQGPCTRAQLKVKEKHEASEMEKIQTAYRLYQNFLKDQSELERQAFLSAHVSEAFLRLPNVIRLETGGLWNHDRFEKSLEVIFGRDIRGVTTPAGGWYWPSGISFRGMELGLNAPITATLLYGLGWANSRVEQIVASHLHWRFFWQTDSAFAIMKNALSKVHRINVRFDGPRLRGRLAEAENQDFEECLTKKRPFEFLTSCSDLTHLDLTWYTHDFDDELDLDHFLGDFAWHFLSSVSFGNFRITEEAFVKFATRHSTSLDQLSLWSITLSEGAWYSTSKRMRKVLRLQKASVLGVFYHNGDNYWYTTPTPNGTLVSSLMVTMSESI